MSMSPPVPSRSPHLGAVVEAIAAQPGYPTVNLPESVADGLGVTRRTVENLLASLERHGALTWHRKEPFGKRRPYWTLSVHEDHAIWADAIAAAPTVAVEGYVR